MMTFMSKNYYTYAYLRLDGTPYYIGRGKGRRAFAKNHTVPPPTRDRVLFLKTGLTFAESVDHERYMIAVLGRKDLGTGILRNLTDGGEGTSGRVVSEDTKQKTAKKLLGRTHQNGHKISRALMGKYPTPGERNPNSRLTDLDRQNIAKEYIPGNKGQGNGNGAVLAERYGVKPNQIRRIATDPRWIS